MKPFLIALQFLTRIPVNFRESPTQQQTARSLLAYPVVGIIIGLILSSIFLLFHFYTPGLDQLFVSAIILTIWVVITGALHLDGLADSADAIVGGFGDSEKTLSIMKDPYCGPVGVVTLLLVLLLKFSAIHSLTVDSYYLLLLAPFIARATILWSFLNIPYIRKSGLGNIFTKRESDKKIIIILIISCLFTLILTNGLGLILLATTLVTLYSLKSILLKRINGMTGDTLGAQVEVIEVIILIVGIIVYNIVTL